MFRKKKPVPSNPWHMFSSHSHSPEQTANAERLLDEAQSLGALSDGHFVSLFEVFATSPGDQHVLDLIQRALQPYRLRNIVTPDPWRPYPGFQTGLDIGEVEIGVINETGLAWRIPISDFPFIAIVGATGSGKTSALFVILESLT